MKSVQRLVKNKQASQLNTENSCLDGESQIRSAVRSMIFKRNVNKKLSHIDEGLEKDESEIRQSKISIQNSSKETPPKNKIPN